MRVKTHYRSVFVSDLHLGAIGANPEAFLEFIESTSCEYLYLVGDVIDGWVGRKDRKWTTSHADVIRVILEFGNRDVRVRYTPGNHDAFMRRLHGTQIGNIEIEHSFVHETVDGREFWVVHGDLFDRTCTKYQPIAFVGAWMYEYLGMVNAKVNRKAKLQGKSGVDFTTAIKRGVKRFIGRATNYEANVVQFARENHFDGVLCGHVHRPQIVTYDDDFVYVNTGDWVENCTAVVEHEDGQLEILYFGKKKSEEARGAWEAIKGLVSSEQKAD
ncbi:metallophosphoesterase family protein [Kamptonema cortianum]|nr:metallophosphoesterase family protein [Geitlerinema splendidum]MDK3161040.1 metallophosphoesterase family protein [Kamptonema cortianum]